jgi:hypothetical protein
LVISCPCGLVISIPLGYFGGVGGAAKRGKLYEIQKRMLQIKERKKSIKNSREWSNQNRNFGTS